MATMNKPKLLLLDEHTAALDPKTALKVLTLSAKIVEENHLTTMMITHNMKDAIKYGNRLIMMHEATSSMMSPGREKEPARLRPAGQVPDRVRRRVRQRPHDPFLMHF